MALSEIEKLERRYADNPQGLTFAPLAEVHRKAGDVPRALELLRSGLALHPDYIPASIVLGRCHFDLGDLPAAEAAFLHVLALDGENVIGLKALADLTERLGRFDESEQWLRTLLEIDRSNDEARDQLGRVDAARRQTESAALMAVSGDDASAGEALEAAAEPVDSPGMPTEPAGAVSDEHLRTVGAEADRAAFVIGSIDEPPSVAMPPLPGPPRAWLAEAGTDAAPLDLEDLGNPADVQGIRPEGIELEQEFRFEEQVPPIEGIVGRDPRPGADAVSSRPSGEFKVETAEDIVLNSSGGSEFQVANAADELVAHRNAQPAAGPAAVPDAGEAEGHAAPEVGPAEHDELAGADLAAEAGTWSPLAGSAEPAANADAASPEPVAPSGSVESLAEPEHTHHAASVSDPSHAPAWAAPVAESPREPDPAPELVITESMAELLLQQGHRAEALTVYRHLEVRSGGEARFRGRIAELEGAASEAATPFESPASAPAYSVRVTHGTSVESRLQSMLAARLPAAEPAAPAAPATAAPAPRPGETEPAGAPTRPAHDSLSLSSVFGDESALTHPAVPSGGGAAGAPAAAGGVSYDEFFGEISAGGAARSSRSADPKSDDLDEFHTWLQNLKR